MMEYLLCSTDFQALSDFVSQFRDKIGPKKGSDAVSVSDGVGGTIQVPARGDPLYWYVNVLTNEENLEVPEGIEYSNEEDSLEVVGQWFTN